MRIYGNRLILMMVSVLALRASASADELAESLRRIDSRVMTAADAPTRRSPDDPRRMLSNDVREQRDAVNHQDVTDWRTLRSAKEWEVFKQRRIHALRESLGRFPEPPDDLHLRVTKTIPGDGFQIDCVLFESRPGLVVTANLYRPAERRAAMPGILICHSHHNPKTQSELQDMGITWARAGCLVLVMDQIGHGERRQHPFRTAEDYDGDFRVSRQDYYFRYNTGIQLHLIGDSLIGWMVWDLMRGVDLLLDQPGIDRQRILLLGAVAGGGDPCAVAAAIDPRITAAVPFNFGGPQPETTFPLSDDAELRFNYVGGGSWESTRNLRLSARDGFLPWVIVGSLAPRRLIYAHEFSWDRDNDPVYRRLQTIYGWYNAADRLATVHGYGRVQLSSNEASHCNNIGDFHRRQIYPALKAWFGMEPPPDPEHRDRREASELLCVEGVAEAADVELQPVHQLAGRLAQARSAEFRQSIARLLDAQRRDMVREAWARILGFTPPGRPTGVRVNKTREDSVQISQIQLETERFSIPMLLLTPPETPAGGAPCVVAVAQRGKAGFLADRSAEIAELLRGGIAVCLPDLPGCGETSPDAYRGRRSAATGISSGRLMQGGTIVGDRVRDLLSVVAWLRTQPQVAGDRIAMWGDSFAAVNAAERNIAVPLGIDDEPRNSEPLGPMLSMLAALFDSKIAAVLSRRGLVSFRSVLDSQFVHIPHDIVVPAALTVGDVPGVAAALTPVPVRVEGLLDGTNRWADSETVQRDWQAIAENAPHLAVTPEAGHAYVYWLIATLTRDE